MMICLTLVRDEILTHHPPDATPRHRAREIRWRGRASSSTPRTTTTTGRVERCDHGTCAAAVVAANGRRIAYGDHPRGDDAPLVGAVTRGSFEKSRTTAVSTRLDRSFRPSNARSIDEDTRTLTWMRSTLPRLIASGSPSAASARGRSVTFRSTTSPLAALTRMSSRRTCFGLSS